MEIIIREMQESDVDELEVLFLIAQRQTFTQRPPEVFQIGDFRSSTAGEIVWVATCDGQLAGFFSISMLDFVHNLFLLRQFQNKGIGSSLLAKAEEIMTSPMELRVAMDNEKVGYFYEKNGWLKISTHKDVVDPYIVYKKWKL